MKKTNVIKIFEVFILLFIISLIFSIKVSASEATITATNCNVGENFTVTVSTSSDIVGYVGNLYITYAGDANPTLLEVIADQSSNHVANYTNSFTAKKSGSAIITVADLKLYDFATFDNLTPGSSYNPVKTYSSLTTTITITDPNQGSNPSTPPQTQPDTSGSTGNSNTKPQEDEKPVVVNFSDVNETMYTNREVNLRQNCGTDYGIIKKLEPGTEVIRTGVGDKKKDGYSWSRVSYDGITGYLITDALTDEAPDEILGCDAQEPLEEPENSENPTDTEDELAKMAEELGAIPEVGLNIMPFMFLGSSIACIILMIEVKKKISK